MRRRHRDWFEGLALRSYPEWTGPEQVNWIARLGREEGNLRAAMEFSLDEPDGGPALRIAVFLYEFWVARQRVRECRYWLDRALQTTGGRPLERIAALCAATVLAAMRTDTEGARTRVEQARVLAEQHGESSWTCMSPAPPAWHLTAHPVFPDPPAWIGTHPHHLRGRQGCAASAGHPVFRAGLDGLTIATSDAAIRGGAMTPVISTC